jgi:putative two-component system response regulator
MATILMIDDDVDFVAIQREILEGAGFTVAAIHSSEEALKSLETGTLPDLIIADLMMEHDDSGFRMCHALKRNPRTARVPILMLTGVVRDRNIGFDLKSPAAREWIKADDFAEKPIRPEQLLAHVRHLLGLPAAAPQHHG